MLACLAADSRALTTVNQPLRTTDLGDMTAVAKRTLYMSKKGCPPLHSLLTLPTANENRAFDQTFQNVPVLPPHCFTLQLTLTFILLLRGPPFWLKCCHVCFCRCQARLDEQKFKLGLNVLQLHLGRDACHSDGPQIKLDHLGLSNVCISLVQTGLKKSRFFSDSGSL